MWLDLDTKPILIYLHIPRKPKNRQHIPWIGQRQYRKRGYYIAAGECCGPEWLSLDRGPGPSFSRPSSGSDPVPDPTQFRIRPNSGSDRVPDPTVLRIHNIAAGSRIWCSVWICADISWPAVGWPSWWECGRRTACTAPSPSTILSAAWSLSRVGLNLVFFSLLQYGGSDSWITFRIGIGSRAWRTRKWPTKRGENGEMFRFEELDARRFLELGNFSLQKNMQF